MTYTEKGSVLSKHDDEVKRLLNCAVQDFHAALSFVDTDPRYIEDHIFGGHLQGCVEKLIKVVLGTSSLPSPRTHDIRVLFGVLGDYEHKVPAHFAILTSLTIYATSARYGQSMRRAAMDRVWFLNLVREFAAWLGLDSHLS